MNRKIVVTGGTRGIGKAIVERFAKSGDQVIFTGRSSTIPLEPLESGCSFFPLDLENREQIESFTGVHGDADVFIHNAGIVKDSLLLRMSDRDFHEVLQVNLEAAFWLAKGFVKGMLKRQKGSIVFISSISARGNPGQANYAASKGGLESLMKTLSLEVAGRQIRVNCVAPGFIDTDLTKEVSIDLSMVPLKRKGKPEEIAEAVYFLADERRASYITGQVLTVDGGLSVGI